MIFLKALLYKGFKIRNLRNIPFFAFSLQIDTNYRIGFTIVNFFNLNNSIKAKLLTDK